jgi:hypothetical protein
LYAFLHLIRLRIIPDFKQIGDRHFHNDQAEHICQGDNPNGDAGDKSGCVNQIGGEMGSHPAIPEILQHKQPTAPGQNEHKPDNSDLHQKVDDLLGDTRHPGQDTVDDKVLVVPHGHNGTQVYEVYEAKSGDFLGPRETLAEQVPENHVHKDKDYHNSQKKRDENFNGPEKDIQ